MQLQFTGLLDAATLLKARQLCPKAVITNWTGDCRAKPMPEFINVSHAVDLSLISSTGQLELYRGAGCKNVRYWQIGFDPKVAFPEFRASFRYDVTFAGNNYGPTFPDGRLRMSAVETLQRTFGDRFGLFGSGYQNDVHPLAFPEVIKRYNDSLCVLSISNFNDVSHYFSDRLLCCLASGRPTISWYFPGCESYFVEGQEIFYARSNEDIVDAIRYCQENPSRAQEIGKAGYLRVMREHTFTSKIFELLDMTKLLPRLL